MLESKIESILFFRNEPISISELAKILGGDKEKVTVAIENLQEFYKNRGIVIVSDGESLSFGTRPSNSELIEKIQKEELSRELGRAGLETLAIVLYRGPVSRREIDRIRGVNSSFILRTLMIRGLIERTEGDPSTALRAGRSYTYKPTLKLLQYLGITRREELPEYQNAFKKMEEFVKTESRQEENV
ncbi:MAG: SMC-Scp complex subunit ScpB [Candidatus Zambryskibacteria bacterium]|nr:SMC-Scp complex subunit ScpB [Candidatus Zambryskibacteria bacterium]